MKTRKRIKLFGDYGILYLGSHEFLFDSEDYDLIRNRDWFGVRIKTSFVASADRRLTGAT